MSFRLGLLAALGLSVAAQAAPPSTAPVAGIRDHSPSVHALVNARLVLEPGKVVEKGTIVLRDGVIEAVGADVKPPADARIWNAAGKTVYAAFLDAFTEAEIEAASLQKGSPHWNRTVTPQLSVAEFIPADGETQKQFRSQGFAARLVAPRAGIIKGRSAIISTGERESRLVVRPEVALHVRLTLPYSHDRQEYPTSPMGAVALARQTFYDADWYTLANKAADANAQLERPERNDALAALAKFQADRGLAIFDCNNEQFIFRAERFIREFGLKAAFRGSGR
jgi:N-acetylglucosamine-6-phosphate deacetylase